MTTCVYCRGQATASVVRVHRGSGWAVKLALCEGCYRPPDTPAIVEARHPVGGPRQAYDGWSLA